MKPVPTLMVAVAVVLGLLPAAAHEDLLGTRHVAVNGVDSGDCRHAQSPCQTLAYAQAQALEGDVIKVSEGTYYANDRELAELFYAPVKMLGGYSQRDQFITQSREQHPTVLIGASTQWQTAARARGFQYVGSGDIVNQVGVSTAAAVTPASCVQGSADVFPCKNIDLLAHRPLTSFSSRPASVANVWGFVDRNDQREYALVGLSNGTAIVDVTDPTNPREVATIAGLESLWREPKVYQYFDTQANRYRAYAYVSTEARGGSVEVIDLSGLPNTVALLTRFSDISSAHTVYVSNIEYAGNTSNTALPAYLVVAGANMNGGALRMYSLANPATPQLVTAPAAGYMHDSTSLIVSDSRSSQCAAGHHPCEVLVDFNENTVDLWDVSNKSAPVQLSSTTYPSARYVHSGWPSDDGRYVFVHDELDELRIPGLRTQIYTLDIANLTAPVLRTSYVGNTNATDHNGYVKGDRLYVSHYRRGLVIFDIADPNNLKEVGNFDTFINPSGDTAGTDGAWGTYPFLPSGNILISDIDNGLFIVRDNTGSLSNRVGRIGFSSSAVAGSESQTQLAITVRRVDGRQGPLTVQYTTASATAMSGSDFQATSGFISWSDGDDSDQTIRVPLSNDSEVESAETFSVTLSNLSAAAQFDGASSLTLTINDDDVPPPSNREGGGSVGIFGLLLLLQVAVYRRWRRLIII